MTKLSAGFTIQFMSIKISIYVNLDQRIDLAINYGDKLFLIIGLASSIIPGVPKNSTTV